MRILGLRELNNPVAKMEFKFKHAGFKVHVFKNSTKMSVLLFHLKYSDSFPGLTG